MDRFKLTPKNSALMVIDIQERMWNALPEKYRRKHLTPMQDIIEIARLLTLPVIITEQYPKGLGKTIPEIKEYIDKFEPPLKIMEKLHFSAMADPTILKTVISIQRSHWIIIGIETHVCIFQTARDLIKRGYYVHVPKDCVISRHTINWETGLNMIKDCGGVITTSEIVIFDLLHIAQGDIFKQMSKRLKER